MSLFSDFKKFAMRGNVVDMAVGVIIGTSFGKITTSLVNDVLMPPLGIFLSEVDFKSLKVDIATPPGGGDPISIKYGMFISTVIDFLLIAFAVLFITRAMTTLRRMEEGPPQPTPPSTKVCPECLSSIPIEAKRCAHCTVLLPAK